MVGNFKKFHQFTELRKFKMQTSLLAQIRDKDKINGAYLLLKRFKNRLKAFDTALHALDKTKATIIDLNHLSSSLDLARSQSIFEDMKLLFDTATRNFDEKLA